VAKNTWYSILFFSFLAHLAKGNMSYCHHLVSVCLNFSHLRFLRNLPIKNKNCLWQPCLLTDQDEMNILYTGPYIDASYQVSFHLAKGFQRRRLKFNLCFLSFAYQFLIYIFILIFISLILTCGKKYLIQYSFFFF
jgi:hypothetical protein